MYREHLKDQLLPFWEQAFDEVYGGIYTCYTNDGQTLVSQDKYTWSQGRMLWVLSVLLGRSSLSNLLSEDQRKSYTLRAKALYAFLDEHAFLNGDDEGCAFLLGREGEVKQGYTSIYADCFVIIGFARYARLVKERSIALKAFGLYTKIQGFIDRGFIRSEPYPIPPHAQSHGISMIMTNTAEELSHALGDLGFATEAQEVMSAAKGYAQAIMDRFVDPSTKLVRELLWADGEEASLLSRHRNPGHAIESMWFCLNVLDESYLPSMSEVVLASLEMGWDHEYGGLFRYIDCTGGPPQGRMQEDAFSRLIATTWDYKLWWPHSEALYATWRLYHATGNEEFLVWYRRLATYTFATFPAEAGFEWIQIRNRVGLPIEGVVALPVKDPFHILRTVMYLIDSEERTGELPTIE